VSGDDQFRRDPPRTAELVAVEALVAERLAQASGSAEVVTVWGDRAEMWFVEIAPKRSEAAAVSIGVEGDTAVVHFGDRDSEMWGKGGELPLEDLGQLLDDVFAGRVRGRWLRGRRSYAPY
jgi:hypothetical protein